MPKSHKITLTARDLIQSYEGEDIDSICEGIIEYAPDFAFPDNADQETIRYHDYTFNNSDHLVIEFYYDEEEEEEEEEDEDEDE